MAAAFPHLPVAAAGLATVFSVVTAFGNAWADNKSKPARWQSAISQSGTASGSAACVEREWKSAVTTIDAQQAIRSRSAVGLQDVDAAGCQNSLGTFDAPKGVPKSARGSAANQIAR
jgi:hypothetical protein